jgi:hypothetical protein
MRRDGPTTRATVVLLIYAWLAQLPVRTAERYVVHYQKGHEQQVRCGARCLWQVPQGDIPTASRTPSLTMHG